MKIGSETNEKVHVLYIIWIMFIEQRCIWNTASTANCSLPPL